VDCRSLAAWPAASASFIPSGPQRELRDLTRYRVRLTQEKAREVNRVQKMLEDTNLKLGDVGSSIMGKSPRMILHAIANGETDPGRLAAFAVGRVHASPEQLEAALRGTVTDHHRFLLSEHLTQIHHLEQAIERVTAEIVRRFTPPPGEATSREAERDQARGIVCLSFLRGSLLFFSSAVELGRSRCLTLQYSRHQ
jgi:hypothetical protein